MKSIIIGTAGHIDHGKTALVKALTGIDADRLAEEKRRGITIDLGFAHMDLPSPNGDLLRIGFVDVPGHERFVRNMLAGVGGIDLVLLVIAADESIMPQTREHFDILQLIGVSHGITVLSKSDAVDAETLDVVRLEVEEFLRETFLEHAPIVAVSSLTGAGLDDLKRSMLNVAAKLPPRDSQALARLPVDRVFTMKGFGTVATGTLISGTIRKEEELQVFPTGRLVRVRGIQVHGSGADSAAAGQRTALNLAGTSTGDLSRGMILAPQGLFAATRRLDVQLRLLSSAPRSLKNHSRVHFHCHTMETVAEIMLRTKQVDPGERVFARVRLPEPALLLPGDRFIIREFSPVITIGGGAVLDGTPVDRTLPAESDLEILAGEDQPSILRLRIERRRHAGISLANLVQETGWTAKFIESNLSKSLAEGQIVRANGVYVSRPAWQELTQQIVDTVTDFYQRNPLSGGISKEELRAQSRAHLVSFDSALQALVRAKQVEIVGDMVRIPGRGVEMKDEEAESKAKIEQAFVTAGLKVPALHDVLSGLKIDRQRAQKIVTLLLRDKVLMKISDDLVFHSSALDELRRQVVEHKSKSPRMDVAQFKELTGVSRKYAIPLLEYLDRIRVTRRVGDTREIL